MSIDGILAIVRCVCFAAEASMGGFCGAKIWASRFQIEAPSPPLLRFAMGAGALAATGHVLQLIARTASMLDEPMMALDLSGIWQIASLTWQGHVWLVQGFLLALALAAIAAKRSTAGLVFAAACLAAGALSSHMISGGENGFVPGLANLLHVLAAGLWFGGLMPLLVIWAQSGAGKLSFGLALAQFSRIALPLMTAIVLSGLIVAAVNTGSWPALFGTEYGWLLGVKLTWVSLLVAAAALLREVFLPEARAGTIRKVMGRILLFEFGAACGVAISAAMLAQTAPGRHEDVVWPLSFRFAPLVAWKTPGAESSVLGGGCLVLLCAALSWGLSLTGRRRLAVVAAATGLATGSAVAIPALTVPAFPTTFTRPPIPYEAAAVTEGLALFQQNCMACHGRTGRGDGPAAAGMIPPPADLTAPHTADHTMGDMFWWVSNGIAPSAMPAFANSIGEKDRWELINYVMALSLGHQARPLGTRVASGFPWLPALDFSFAQEGSTPIGLANPRGVSTKLVVLVNQEDGLEPAKEMLETASAIKGLTTVAVLPESLRGLQAEIAADAPSRKVIVDTGVRILPAWRLYRRTLQHPDFGDNEPDPPVLAFLIDRFGFVRARWRSNEGEGLNTAHLAADVSTLASEPDIVGPDSHVH
jgi:putative copper resistance protein D